MTVTLEAAVVPGLDADVLRAQIARHGQLGVTTECASCHARFPCSYRESARNKLRAAGVHVGDLL